MAMTFTSVMSVRTVATAPSISSGLNSQPVILFFFLTVNLNLLGQHFQGCAGAVNAALDIDVLDPDGGVVNLDAAAGAAKLSIRLTPPAKMLSLTARS